MSSQPVDPNPYASPTIPSEPVPDYKLPPHVVAKAKAIIADAGLFWLVILIGIACPSFGSLFAAPWYLVRLWQWNSLARCYPLLVQPDYAGSLPQRFQGAKIKLIIGMSFGVFMLGVIALLIMSGVLGGL